MTRLRPREGAKSPAADSSRDAMTRLRPRLQFQHTRRDRSRIEAANPIGLAETDRPAATGVNATRPIEAAKA